MHQTLQMSKKVIQPKVNHTNYNEMMFLLVFVTESN